MEHDYILKNGNTELKYEHNKFAAKVSFFINWENQITRRQKQAIASLIIIVKKKASLIIEVN